MVFYKIAHFLVEMYIRIVFRYKVTGRENIPEGGCLVCARHYSMSDPIYVAIGLGRKHRVSFMAKKELFKNKLLGWLISSLGAFPVERGPGDLGAIKSAVNVLKQGRKLILFPEGTRVEYDTPLEQLKTGAAMIATHAKMPILPLYLTPKRKYFKRLNARFGKVISSENPDGLKSAEHYENINIQLVQSLNALEAGQ